MTVSRVARRRRPVLALAPLAALMLLGGCATTAGEYRLAEKDPLEKVNRGIWAFDQAADKVVMKPVTKVYRAVAPQPVRHGVSNAFANLTEPWSFINNVLQGKLERAAHNLGRFVVNSTIGIAGLFDHASKMGIAPAYEDLGQTLAVWGVNGGPYLVLPLFGPSTLRDGIGTGAAAYIDPVNIAIDNADVSVWYKRGYRAAQIISARSDLMESGGDAFLESSLDPYAAARSAYLQQRMAAIRDQEASGDAGPEDEAPLPGEDVPTPVGDAAAEAPSAAPLPGDAPPADAAPESAAPLPGDPPAADAAPESAAPLPGDAPAADAAPESAAPLPGDPPPPAPAPAESPQP